MTFEDCSETDPVLQVLGTAGLRHRRLQMEPSKRGHCIARPTCTKIIKHNPQKLPKSVVPTSEQYCETRVNEDQTQLLRMIMIIL